MTMPARSAVTLVAGMTHAQARRAVAAAWSEVVLDLYTPSTAFYKEGFPYPKDSWTGDADVLRLESPSGDRPAPPPVVLLTGTMSGWARTEAVSRSFGLVPDFHSRYSFRFFFNQDTLDDMQVYGERMRAAYISKHGREPGVDDSFDGVTGG